MSASAALFAVMGCGDDPASDDASTLTDPEATTTASGPSSGGSEDSLGESSDSGEACDPQWMTIPDQTWIVGTPVELDLAPYLEGADATMLSLMLEGTLPDGVVLEGTVLRGTPTAPTETELVAAVEVEAC